MRATADSRSDEDGTSGASIPIAPLTLVITNDGPGCPAVQEVTARMTALVERLEEDLANERKQRQQEAREREQEARQAREQQAREREQQARQAREQEKRFRQQEERFEILERQRRIHCASNVVFDRTNLLMVGILRDLGQHWWRQSCT